ncbi:hypothetical protein [Cronobacter sakazakii]|uniref:hypothetical protein n=1 Tax=Cronobacter sakazakii TaxID=28141 RepID=UPI000BE94A30|nr:hypothetical protein [Cronobacter sakazakii]
MSEISEAIKQKAAEMEAENDLVTIPRGLLGAALAVIKRPDFNSDNVIELLRYYAFAKEAPVALRERAEPVAWRHDDGPFSSGALTRSKSVAGSWIANGWKVTPPYTAPPAQVVPDDALTRLAFNIALYFADEETKNNKELFHKLIDHAVDDCRSFMRATIPDPVVADSLVSELLAIAKRAAEEADECANAEFSDNSMKHAREIAEWERRAAILQPVSQHYKLPGKEG